ncbi:MAG: hypothetical protein RSA68_13280 [Hafnia sp.]|uniref:hypothetical protein n=1 Tax=Hafnia sp. TaxID=1873498 RepID=UPI002FC5E588
MMSIKIECFFSSRDEKKKLIILNKIKNITANVENIIQSDNQYSFVIKKTDTQWQYIIFNAIQICQEIGYQWILTGDIEHEYNAWSNHPKTTGIKAINVVVERAY